MNDFTHFSAMQLPTSRVSTSHYRGREQISAIKIETFPHDYVAQLQFLRGLAIYGVS